MLSWRVVLVVLNHHFLEEGSPFSKLAKPIRSHSLVGMFNFLPIELGVHTSWYKSFNKKIKKYLQTRLALNKSTLSDLGILEILSYNLNFLKGALVLKNQWSYGWSVKHNLKAIFGFQKFWRKIWWEEKRNDRNKMNK